MEAPSGSGDFAFRLLDEIDVSLVPVLLGDGVPFFARYGAARVALADPEVVQGHLVTHLRFTVL